jgi:hypothetical protein
MVEAIIWIKIKIKIRIKIVNAITLGYPPNDDGSLISPLLKST